MDEFPAQMHKRREHLDQLPGKGHLELGESLNRASKLLGKNAAELRGHLMTFVGQPTFVNELPEEYNSEAARLLLNFLAALAGLRDAQRAVHHRLWPVSKKAERNACETCGHKDPPRTQWEINVWDPKRLELLGDERIVFLTKLRDYSLHYATPVLTVATNFSSISPSGSGGPMKLTNAVGIGRDKLLEWSRWNATARAFITGYDSDTIDLLPLVDFYLDRVSAFVQWFGDQIDGAVGRERHEYLDKANDLNAWVAVHLAASEYRRVRSSENLRQRVQARLERAANKTGGWRIIAPDENGEWVVGDSEWPPLPPDWRR